MDDLSEKQIKHIRELCDVKGFVLDRLSPLDRLAFVGLTIGGMLMDQMLAERAAAVAAAAAAAAAGKGKPK
jgi:hypothetical protein